jgi:hypothetical protein
MKIFGDDDAADAQIQAAERSTAAQVQAQREAILARERAFEDAEGFLKPFQRDPSTFQGGLDRVRALVGASGVDAQRDALANFQESPGVAFLRERGLEGLRRGAAASGGLGGGNLRKAEIEFSQGLALQDFNNQLNNLLQVSQSDQNVQLGLAQGLANLRTGLGASQAQGQANIGQAQAQGFTTRGNIQASERLSQGQRIGSGIGAVLGGAFGGPVGASIGSSIGGGTSGLSFGF